MFTLSYYTSQLLKRKLLATVFLLNNEHEIVNSKKEKYILVQNFLLNHNRLKNKIIHKTNWGGKLPYLADENCKYICKRFHTGYFFYNNYTF